MNRPAWLHLPHRRPDPADCCRDDYLTVEQHQEEAERLLWVIDGELQSGAPRTMTDLAIIALAHAVTALAADKFSKDGKT